MTYFLSLFIEHAPDWLWYRLPRWVVQPAWVAWLDRHPDPDVATP